MKSLLIEKKKIPILSMIHDSYQVYKKVVYIDYWILKHFPIRIFT